MKKTANKQEREYMATVASLGCVVCRNLGYGASPAEIHHIRATAGMGQRSPHYLIIPLCPDHHRNGGRGVALHFDQRDFEKLYGTEYDLLAQTISDVFLYERSTL